MAATNEAGSNKFSNVMQNLARIAGVGVIVMLSIIAVAVWREPLRWRLFAQDFFTLANYQPSNQEQQWSKQLKLTNSGEDILFASQPELVESAKFADACPTKEETNVLGCYLTSSKIYVLDVEVSEIEEVEEVTLAHEILHGVWDRLPSDNKQQLERKLLQHYRELDNDELNKLIAGYRRSAPTGQADAVTATELHSILGTEYEGLPESIESHYDQYFKDRSVIVEMYKSYEKQFESRRQQARKISNQLDDLNQQITAKDQLVDRQIVRNQELIAQISRLRDQERIEESNKLVPVQNQLVDEINQNINQYNELIERFNSLGRSYEQLSFELNELYDSLDTRNPVQ